MTDRTVVYRIQADVTQARAQVAALGASVKKSADDMTAATREGSKFRGGLDSLGNTAGKIGLVAAVGLGAAVKKAADFDSAMSNVKAATHETAAAMDDLRDAALQAGQDTAFSATEAAAGIENLAKAGVSTTEILNGGLNGALSLAAAGGMEVADAAEAAAGAMAQFGLSGDQVPHIADLLAAAAGKAQGDVSDFTMALKQGGTVAAQTGLSLEETTGALAAMAEQSLLGSDAGTSFKTMLSSLTPNSKKAADAMEQYNINAFDAQGNFVGMTALAGQLEAGLGDLTNEQRAMALETIFGSDAVRAASIIYDNGAEGIADWTAKVNDAGFAAETAAIKQDNLRGDIEKLGGALETALIGTGSSSQGPLRALTQSLESTVNAYNDLGEGAKSGVAITLAATATIGGGLFVFSRMVQSIAATRAAMEALGISAQKTQGLVSTAGKGMGVALAAGLAIAASDLFDTDYSLDSINRQLELLAAQGDAAGVLEGLSMSADTLGEALRDAAFNDFNMFGMGAGKEIEELDAALSALDPSTAAETYKVLVEEGTKAGLTTAEVADLFPKYAAALKLAAQEAEAGIGPTEDYAAAVATLPEPISTAAREADNLKNTIERLNGVLDQRGNVRDYQAAIDDFTEGLKENGRSFDINTEKGRANQANLDNIAGSVLKVAEGLGTAARKKFLTNAIADMRTMGDNMDLPKSEINRLIELLRVANKTNVKPEIDADTTAAMTAIERVRNALLGIKDKSVTVRVTQTGAAVTPGYGPDAKPSADGGTVPKTGKPYADRHLYLLADGEEVISNRNGQADRHRALLKSINGGLADGGTAGDKPKRRTRAFSVTDNTDALQAALDRLTARTDEQSAAVDAQRKALEGATEATEFWGSKMADVAKGTVSGFDSGLFGRDSNVWASGAGGGATFNLNRDIAGLQERSGLQAQLAAAGLSGDALAAILSEGTNADISALLASGQAGSVGALFNQRAALQGSVGAAAGQAAYGPQFAAAERTQQRQLAALGAQLAEQQASTAAVQRMEAKIASMSAQVAALNADQPERIGAVINGAASKGHREKQWRNN